MRLLFLFITVSVLRCSAQKSSQELSREEYEIVNAVLDDYGLKKFLLNDEDYHYDLSLSFKVYIHWYIKYLETGKSGPPTSKDIQWILNSNDISFISVNLEYDTVRIKWDKYKLNRPEILYASEHPELLNSTDVPRLGLIHISKPYLNRKKNKAVIFIVRDAGYLILVEKIDDKWQLCGKIEYMSS